MLQFAARFQRLKVMCVDIPRAKLTEFINTNFIEVVRIFSVGCATAYSSCVHKTLASNRPRAAAFCNFKDMKFDYPSHLDPCKDRSKSTWNPIK